MPNLIVNLPLSPAFSAGLVLSLSLIMALGPQNVHVMRMGLRGEHVVLTVVLCIASDVLLIALGVLGLAQLGGLSSMLQTLLISAGIVFLLVYGAQAFGRFRAGDTPPIGQTLKAEHQPMTRQQATLAALAFAWLNPHAWLDTAVLIGSASLAWGTPGNTLFGMGAATGSALWFAGLGLCVFGLGQRLSSPTLWRRLDGLVAVMMWGTALMLGRGLLV